MNDQLSIQMVWKGFSERYYDGLSCENIRSMFQDNSKLGRWLN